MEEQAGERGGEAVTPKPITDEHLARITRAVFALDNSASRSVIGRILRHLGGCCAVDGCCDLSETNGIPAAFAELDALESEHWWMEKADKHAKALATFQKRLAELRRALTEAS